MSRPPRLLACLAIYFFTAGPLLVAAALKLTGALH
jgi:hypothetical protein